MSWPQPIADGTNVRCILLQLDVVESSQLSGPELALQEAKEVLRRFVKGALRVYAGYEMCWPGDGGVFLFPADTKYAGPWPWDSAVLGALQVLDTLSLFNQRLNPLDKDLRLRISVDEGIVVWSKDPSLMQGRGLDYFVKHERDLAVAGHVTLTGAVYENLRLRQVKHLFVPSCLRLGLYVYPDDRLQPETKVQVEVRRELGSFPEGFDPLLVIVGARFMHGFGRRPLRHYAAAPASGQDLALLGTLRLPPQTLVCLDEEVVDDDEVLGRYNLLSLAGLKTNLVSRMLNDVSPFRFYIPPEVSRALRALEADPDFEAAMGLDWETVRWHFGAASPAEGVDRLRELLSRRIHIEDAVAKVAGTAVADPVESSRHGLDASESLGLVSLCPNPHSPGLSAILAGGIRSLGTRGALAALAEAGTSFKARPLGGAFRYNEATVSPIPALRKGRLTWLTGTYSVDSLLGRLNDLKGDALERLFGVGGICEVMVNE